jgi:glycosyltransferase involved in cell wall biosynthesis
VIPNGVDTARLRRVPPSQNTDASLLFAGTLSYPPNAEAVRWFVDEILPRVRERRSDVTLTVVGRDPPPRVARLAADPAVRVVGWIDDIATAYEHASVVIAPLRTGSGTKLKVLEALAAARPLVATSVATEGIEIEDGEHVLVADDAAGFADAVVLLLADAALRRRIGEAGRQRVTTRYDWEPLGERLSKELERWLKR